MSRVISLTPHLKQNWQRVIILSIKVRSKVNTADGGHLTDGQDLHKCIKTTNL